MSILSVANVHFEATGSYLIDYLPADNRMRIRAPGGIDLSNTILQLTTTDDNSSNSTFYPFLSTSNAGVVPVNTISSSLYYVPNTGTLSATNFNTLSDINYKKDIEVIPNALDKVDQLFGISFTWIDNDQKSMGVRAQDVEIVAPELVTETNGKKSVNYDGLIGLLIECVKELKNRVETLENNK